MDGCGFSEKPLSISLHPMCVCSSSLSSGQVSITIKQPPNPVITKPYETILKQLLFVVLKSSPDFSQFPLFLHVQFLFSLQFPSFLLNPNPFSLFHQNPKRKKTELPISFFFLKSSVLTNKASWFPLSTKMSFPSSRRTSKKPFLQLSLPGQSSAPLSVFLTTTLSLSPCFHTPSQKHSKSLTDDKSSPCCCGVFACCLSAFSSHSFQHKSSQNNHQTLLLCLLSDPIPSVHRCSADTLTELFLHGNIEQSSSSNIPSTQAGGCIRDVLCSADNTETEFHHNPLRDTPISLSVQLKEKPIPCQVSFLSVSLILLTAESPSTSLPEPVCCGVCACVSSQDIQTGKRGVETTGGVLQLGVNRGGEGSSGEGSHSLICFVCPELHKLLSENKIKQNREI